MVTESSFNLDKVCLTLFDGYASDALIDTRTIIPLCDSAVCLKAIKLIWLIFNMLHKSYAYTRYFSKVWKIGLKLIKTKAYKIIKMYDDNIISTILPTPLS